jgi:hypothetical protein
MQLSMVKLCYGRGSGFMNKHGIHSFLVKILLSMCLCLFGCTQQHIVKKKIFINPYSASTKLQATADNTYKPPLTVWIHGTSFLYNSLFVRVFNRVPSLRPALYIDKRYKARNIVNALNTSDPLRFPLQTFYVFCWSGDLNAHVREKTAHQLYAELRRVIDEYQEAYGCAPRIQMVTHSHGGNVVLNLSKIKNPDHPCLCIDTLVLLACPVQIRTISCIDDPMFQRIYSLYSNLDFVQVIAPQIIKKEDDCQKGAFAFPPFSKRCFPYRPHITQAKIKVDNRALWHNDFVQPKFLRLLPSIIAEFDAWDTSADYLNLRSYLGPSLDSLPQEGGVYSLDIYTQK